MPRKGMRSIFFLSPPAHPAGTAPPSPHRPSVSEFQMEATITAAESLIVKWDPSASAFASVTSLFYDNRREARDFLRAVRDLHAAMLSFVSRGGSGSSPNLLRAQTLMQAAMKRLEKEFYQILAANRDCLDPESVSARSSARTSISDFDDDGDGDGDGSASDDEIRAAGESISELERVASLAMADLRAIADCMIAAGYGKECVKIYKIIRKSIIDEGLYHLGIEKLTASQMNKMDWDLVELKLRHWLGGVRTAVRTLFYGERVLCDQVFSSSDSIRESCFAEISREGALMVFEFAELVARFKKTPEKMFRTLDLYEAVAELRPEIESIFFFESTSAVRSQAATAVSRLADSIRAMLADFEAAIQKDASRSAIPGGGVHPLTRYVMNYLALLSDYSGILSDVLADWPLKVQQPLPEGYLNGVGGGGGGDSAAASSPISVRVAWLVLVLLCKLDGKAELYKDASLAYIFLANNLQYVVSKVRGSSLRHLLGGEWLAAQEAKVRQYAANYERMGWSKVLDALPENPASAELSPEEAKGRFRRFDAAFGEAYRRQTTWVVADPKLRDEIKVSIARKLGPRYREFYERFVQVFGRKMRVESIARFSPDDLGNYLSDLFFGTGFSSGCSTPSSSSPSPSSSPSHSLHSFFNRRSR